MAITVPQANIVIKFGYHTLLGKTFPADCIQPGDILTRLDIPKKYLVLDSTQRYGPRTRILKYFDLIDGTIFEEEVESFVAKFWELYRDGVKLT